MLKKYLLPAIWVFLLTLTGFSPAFSQCAQNPLAVTCDNFESYTVGVLSPQADWWTPWSPPEDGVLSAVVSTDYASQGTKSMKVMYDSQNGTQGDDQVLLLGGKTSGRYELKWKELILPGHAGYLNIQNSQTVGTKWNLDLFFDSTGTGRMVINPSSTGQAPNATFTFPRGQWFPVRFYFDLDNNIAKLFINDQLVLGWAYPDNLGGIDFYALTQWDLVYIDELEYVGLPAQSFNVDFCNSAIDLTQFFGQPPAVAQTTGIYDNTHATVSASDPQVTCWNEPAGYQVLNNTLWYNFTGDGHKYHIETVPCNSTNYIGSSLPIINSTNPAGDTQLALYSGSDCNTLTLEACNDDLNPNGEPDWRAGLDFQTASGKNYYMMIDGYNYGNGLVATGQFCIQVTRIPNITCNQGHVGTYSVSNGGYICNNADVLDLINLGAGYTIPDIGPVYGMSWAITTQEVPPGIWPPTMGAAYIDATVFVPDPTVFSSPNVYSQVLERYITPVVMAGGFLYSPSNPPKMNNVNPANGCFFTGKSTKVTFLPILNPLSGQALATPAALGNNGKISLTVGGAAGEATGDPAAYRFLWSNGDTTQNLANLPPGNYTVTISDIGGCVTPIVVTAQVTTAAGEPGSIRSLVVSPNPAAGLANIDLRLETPAPVQVAIINAIGQVLHVFETETTDVLHRSLNLANFPEGTYFIRITIDGKPVIRRLDIQR
jgi:hypothetical protein